MEALAELGPQMPAGVTLVTLFRQADFIEASNHNVIEALRDGAIFVAIVLFLFLQNLRTTFITLTAIPLSIVITGLVFKWFDMSINTMTTADNWTGKVTKPDGQVSNVAGFQVKAPTAAPTISSVSPNPVTGKAVRPDVGQAGAYAAPPGTKAQADSLKVGRLADGTQPIAEPPR